MTDDGITCLRATQSSFQDICQLTDLGFHFDLLSAKHNSFFKYDNFFVVYSQQQPVASGCIHNMTCQVDGVDLAIAPVGIVTTHPAHRGKRYGLRLMQTLIDSAREDGYDLSLVFPWLEAWYAKVGYASIHAPYRKIDQETLCSHADITGYQVRAFTQQDAETVAAIHPEFSRRLSGTLKRENSHWAWTLEEKGNVMVAERDGAVAAYMVCKPLDANNGTGSYGLKVREFGCWDGCEAGIDALFCAQAAWLEALGFAAIYYEDVYDSRLPSEACAPPYQQLTPDPGVVLTLPDQFMVQMYRVLNLRSILRKLTESWNRRLGFAGMCWQDFFEIEQREVESHNRYTVRFLESGTQLAFSEAAFISLFLFGASSWGSVERKGAPACSDREHEAMHRLFPRRRFVYWDTDSF